MRHDRPTEEDHTLRGAIDRPALLTIRDIIEEIKSLATTGLDDYLTPSVLEVTLDDGLCDAVAARIDVQWTTRDDYKFHYTDTADVNPRWGNRPHGGDYIHVSGTEHYHPPPDASSDPADVEDSCITQSPEELVTRAVLKLWRVAYHSDPYSPLNAGSNPPRERKRSHGITEFTESTRWYRDRPFIGFDSRKGLIEPFSRQSFSGASEIDRLLSRCAD